MRFRFAIVAVLFATIALAIGFSATAHASSTANTVGGDAAPCVQAGIATAAATHAASIVITFGDGKPTLKICVQFNEDSITGLELLKRVQYNPQSPNLTVLTGSTGDGGVCSIDGVGSDDPTDCFKFCKSSPCHYWAYFQRENDAWQFSPVGAGSRTIHDGDTDGWSWGSGGGAPPDSPGQICPLPTSTPPATTVPPTATTTPMPATEVPAEPSNMPASIAAATQHPATPSAAPTSERATTAPQSTTPADAPAAQPSVPDAAAPVTPVNVVAGAAVTPVASASASASRTASSVAATSTPQSGVSIVEPDAGLRNASAAQRRHGGGFDIVPIAGFGSVVAALAAVGGFVWYRRRQLDA